MEGAPFPEPLGGEEENRRGGEHREGDGDPVSAGEGATALETEHEGDTADGEDDIDAGNINLSVFALRGVADFHSGDVAHLDALHGEGEGSGNECLGGNDGGGGGEGDEWVKEPTWSHIKEGILLGLGMSDRESALSEVV